MIYQADLTKPFGKKFGIGDMETGERCSVCWMDGERKVFGSTLAMPVGDGDQKGDQGYGLLLERIKSQFMRVLRVVVLLFPLGVGTGRCG